MIKDFISDEEMAQLEKQGVAKSPEFLSDEEMLQISKQDQEKTKTKGFFQGLNEGIIKPITETVAKPVVQAITEPFLRAGATIAELPVSLSYNKALDKFHKNPTKENLDNLQLEQNALLFLREGVDFGFFGKATPAKTEREALGIGAELGSTVGPTRAAGAVLKGMIKGKIAEPILTGIKGGAQGGFTSGIGKQIEKENIPLGERATELGLETAGGAIAGGLTAGAGIGIGKVLSSAFKIKPNIDPIIDEAIEKGIRPSVSGKKTSAQYSKYQSNARIAVKAIVGNKDNISFANEEGKKISGELPKSLKQFSEAIGQTKELVYKEYDRIAKEAGEKGAEVNTSDIANELLKITDDPKYSVLEDQNPKIADYLIEKISTLQKRGIYTAEQAQASIKLYNDSLESFYKNPSYESASKVAVDAMIVNRLRKSLDATIEKTTGKEYQQLKNLYGSLKAIEGDVSHRVIVDARKNVKGLVDFGDIFTSGQVLDGILSMNPTKIAQGTLMKGIQEAYKRFNDPNRIIEKMFEQAGRQ